ncbi:MAG TPA: hypothetical protein VGL99_19530 [Chloroflexota bacterium]|jgi:hypothetical protein
MTPLEPRSAREQGIEGVACVDDAARAIVLYSKIWRHRRVPSASAAAASLLRFLGYMQDHDGRFGNFILDWNGRRNRVGSTSQPGGPAWQARALHALAFGHGTEWEVRFERALRWVDEPSPYLDVRAVGVLAVLEHWRATGSSDSAERALTWSREIAGHASEAGLLNAAGVTPIHLWGHLQEVALAETGRAFSQPELVECARASAEALLLPAVECGFDFARVLPFDVSCTVAGLAAVARATSNERYALAAACGRQWFHGRNSARQPVYDTRRGMVFDGIDHGRVSRNSGAESNIEGALALLGDHDV